MNKEHIQFLRQESGAGIMDCRNALRQAEGDLNQALQLLKERGLVQVQKREEAVTADGIAYAACFEGIAVLMEVNCETDFVAANADFVAAAAEIAALIAQAAPADTDALLALPLAEGVSVRERLQKMSVAFGEKISLRRFARFEEGINSAYMHQQGRMAVILSLNADRVEAAETQHLARELMLQIAAMAPRYVSRDALTAQQQAELAEEMRRETLTDESLQGKPAQVLERIIAGKIEKHYRRYCLLEQAYIRDNEKSIAALLREANAAHAGEIELSVRAFVRYEKAEGMSNELEQNLKFAQQFAG